MKSANIHQTLPAALVLLLGVATLQAQEPGTNITKKTGIISNLDGGPAEVEEVTLTPPKAGEDYEIKINFFKVESSAEAADAYFDALNEQAQARGEDGGSTAWNVTREGLKDITSRADFEVYDRTGKLIGRVIDLAALTFFKTVKFRATSSQYRVRILCRSGAGLYHLTFEYD